MCYEFGTFCLSKSAPKWVCQCDVTAVVLLQQNKEQTAILKKLEELISMKTKEILSAAILNKARTEPKTTKTSLNWIAVTIEKPSWYNRTTQKSHHCLCVLFCILFLLLQVTCIDMKRCKLTSRRPYCCTKQRQSDQFREIGRAISMKTKENLDQPPFWEKLVLALSNITKTGIIMSLTQKTIQNRLNSTEETIEKPSWYNNTTQKNDHCLASVLCIAVLCFQVACIDMKRIQVTSLWPCCFTQQCPGPHIGEAG